VATLHDDDAPGEWLAPRASWISFRSLAPFLPPLQDREPVVIVVPRSHLPTRLRSCGERFFIGSNSHVPASASLLGPTLHR
jgi:hypothetical protein